MNGVLDGSPGHHGFTNDDDYCMSTPAERFACAVVETGRLR